MTDHLLISLEFSLFLPPYFFISLLGGLSTTDHLLISLEFSFFLSFFLSLFLFLPYTFLCTRLLEIDKVNFLQISVSHQAL